MQSMTGYGREVLEDEQYRYVVEVAAVNRKGLEVVVTGPKEWFQLDRIAMELAKQHFERGRIQAQIRVQPVSSDQVDAGWDFHQVQTKLEQFRKLCEHVGIAGKVSAEGLIQLMRLSGQESQTLEWERSEAKVQQVLEGAFLALKAMREQEGEALQCDLLQRLEVLEGIAGKVTALAPLVGPAYRKQMLDRLTQSGLDLDPSDERILKEIALFVDRSDISEELTRLRSHFVQLRDTLRASGAVGRKIDFILQEVFREFNTIGSKANQIEISQLVIAAKNELERLREQAQNVE